MTTDQVPYRQDPFLQLVNLGRMGKEIKQVLPLLSLCCIEGLLMLIQPLPVAVTTSRQKAAHAGEGIELSLILREWILPTAPLLVQPTLNHLPVRDAVMFERFALGVRLLLPSPTLLLSQRRQIIRQWIKGEPIPRTLIKGEQSQLIFDINEQRSLLSRLQRLVVDKFLGPSAKRQLLVEILRLIARMMRSLAMGCKSKSFQENKHLFWLLFGICLKPAAFHGDGFGSGFDILLHQLWHAAWQQIDGPILELDFSIVDVLDRFFNHHPSQQNGDRLISHHALQQFLGASLVNCRQQ
ncbi:MAG: hypothetical protein ACK6BC_04350, partial [Cyanobacteriota bacterium]